METIQIERHPGPQPIEYYGSFTGTFQYNKRPGDDIFVYTDGIAALAVNENAQWLIDFIRSYIGVACVKAEPFQVFKLQKFRSGRMLIKIEDGNENIVAVQKIDNTDFPFDSFSVWCVQQGQARVIMLPSEY